MRGIRHNVLGALVLKLCFVSSFYGILKLDNLHLLRQKRVVTVGNVLYLIIDAIS